MKFYLFLIPLFFTSMSFYCQTTTEEKMSIKNWHFKDYADDKILGISLDKFYKLKKNKPKSNKIIVAVLDTQIDLKHQDLKPSIWLNKKEIPNNGIDDDRNGYVDDIHGWDFVGFKQGGCLVYQNFEYVRLVRELDSKFKDKKREDIQKIDLENYDEYQRALMYYTAKNKYYKNWQKSLNFNLAIYNKVKDTLKYFFPKENYTLQQLDSLYKIHKINDKKYIQRRDNNDQDLGALIDYMIVNLEVQHFTIEDIKTQKNQLDSILSKSLNIDYDERQFISDNPNQLEKGYGNNKIGDSINGSQLTNKHSTAVSGVIGANKNNKIGIEGFSDNILIMPLHLSATGDENDKDIASAIYYAVDNGAKVINMSFGKEFSLHKDWIRDAFKYAEDHNVLLVHAVGNDGVNIDVYPFYPNDYNYDNREEISNNFINVASINSNYGEHIVSNFSNYGKKNVDIFAPGEDIYTTFPNNDYNFESGTSLAAPMVSGTAALIWSYYPNLTVQQVKEIILTSGVNLDLEVIEPRTKLKKIKFSELSLSGKVLNAYNAMKMAEKWNTLKN